LGTIIQAVKPGWAQLDQNCPNGFLRRRWKASEVVIRNGEWLATFWTSHGVGNVLEWGTVFALQGSTAQLVLKYKFLIEDSIQVDAVVVVRRGPTVRLERVDA